MVSKHCELLVTFNRCPEVAAAQYWAQWGHLLLGTSWSEPASPPAHQQPASATCKTQLLINPDLDCWLHLEPPQRKTIWSVISNYHNVGSLVFFSEPLDPRWALYTNSHCKRKGDTRFYRVNLCRVLSRDQVARKKIPEIQHCDCKPRLYKSYCWVLFQHLQMQILIYQTFGRLSISKIR